MALLSISILFTPSGLEALGRRCTTQQLCAVHSANLFEASCLCLVEKLHLNPSEATAGMVEEPCSRKAKVGNSDRAWSFWDPGCCNSFYPALASFAAMGNNSENSIMPLVSVLLADLQDPSCKASGLIPCFFSCIHLSIVYSINFQTRIFPAFWVLVNYSSF